MDEEKSLNLSSNLHLQGTLVNSQAFHSQFLVKILVMTEIHHVRVDHESHGSIIIIIIIVLEIHDTDRDAFIRRFTEKSSDIVTCVNQMDTCCSTSLSINLRNSEQ